MTESNKNLKIGILVCKEVSDKCSAGGCFKAFNLRKDAFEAYEGAIELASFTHCSGCDEEAEMLLEHKIQKMKKAGVEVIHLSTCIRGRCHKYEAFAEKLAAHFHVKGYTHGSKEGKKKNTIEKQKNNKKPFKTSS